MKIVTVIFSLLIFTIGSHAESRNWTDNTGTFSFEGTYVQTRGTEVMLKRTDGSLLRVKMDRLSQADRDFIANMTSGLTKAEDPLTGIAWYSSVDPGFAEAKRSKRPIMFMAAATQCGGVPGIF